MQNDLLTQKSCWKRNWKWLVPVVGIVVISLSAFFSSGMNDIATDLTQAYADIELYEQTLKKANADTRVQELLGELKPIDRMAILEGKVSYENDNNTLESIIRITL